MRATLVVLDVQVDPVVASLEAVELEQVFRLNLVDDAPDGAAEVREYIRSAPSHLEEKWVKSSRWWASLARKHGRALGQRSRI